MENASATEPELSLQAVKLDNTPASAAEQTSSKSRRRKKAKQASRARRDAAGDGESSGSPTEPPSDSSSLPAVQERGRKPTTSTRKKAKSRNKQKSSLVLTDSDRLLSPTKKCQHEEKIAKALENRGLILQGKSEKVRQQTKKVEDARQHKAAALLHIRDNLTDRLKRAEENRLQQITTIKIKARDEGTKVDEITFMNNLKSQNRIMDVIEKDQKVTSRQQMLEEERAKRNEENRARDAAVEDRRRQQDRQRLRKMTEMEEKKRLKVKKVEQNVNRRLQLVRGKAHDHQRKLSAIDAAQQANLNSLKERIQRKTEVSTRLHEERMELKRLRAQYLRSPRPGSADSARHLQELSRAERCRSHTGDNSPRRETDVKKKMTAQIEMDDISSKYQRMANKLRHRLQKESVGIELPSRGSHSESGDVSHALDILSSLRLSSSWTAWTQHLVTSLDASLERLTRHIAFVMPSKEKNMSDELKRGAMQIVQYSIQSITSSISGQWPSPLPEKPVCAMYNLLTTLLASDTFVSLMRTDVFVGVLEQAKYFADVLIFSRNGKDIVPESVFNAAFQALEGILSHFQDFCRRRQSSEDDRRFSHLTKYLMSCGLIQMIGRYHTLPLHRQDDRLRYLRPTFHFTTSISRFISIRKVPVEQEGSDGMTTRSHDVELLIYRDVLKSGPVFSSVTLLYDLLRLGRSQRRSGDSCISQLAEESYRLALDIIRMLNYIGAADLLPLQTVFRDLALSIQFRHICSFLIEHCLSFDEERAHLLHEVVLLIGQFAFLSTDHQDILHAGHPPTLLQQLARFPLQYFACARLQDVLLPTLIISSFQNRKNSAVLMEELDLNHLTLYIKDKELNRTNDGMDKHFALARKATPSYQTLFREHSRQDFLRYCLASRFPSELWRSAAQFFFVSSTWEEDVTVARQLETSVQDENLHTFYRQMSSMLSDGGGRSKTIS